jgi:hypothetical protein
MERWVPWVNEALDMMDSEGAFVLLPYTGGLRAQPAFDMSVLRVVRAEWCRLLNEQTEARLKKDA